MRRLKQDVAHEDARHPNESTDDSNGGYSRRRHPDTTNTDLYS